ncbi:hypothetical protein HHI36_004507 [Cryptolaemus montrouzieri]|uniref:Uncharacterized protein n=1 Tax=Cryptolaemus montrouzieri TaxID=559131 RepID=A0ABD2NRP8_9CUCU
MKCKSAILTDTPEKTYSDEKIKEQDVKKKVSKHVFSVNKEDKKDSKGRKMKKKTVAGDNYVKEEEEFCLVRLSPYSAKKNVVKYVFSARTAIWAHEVCTPGLPNYICQNCDCDYSDGLLRL